MTYVSMRIELKGDSLPDREEFDLRWDIRDKIEEAQIGDVIGSGGGRGEMDIGVEVADAEAAISQMRAIAQQFGLTHVEFTES